MLTEPERLNQSTQAVLLDAETEVFVSAVSVWELGIKRAIGKIAFPPGLLETSEDRFLVRFLPISVSHAQAAPQLPLLHKDPFDRMLVAQANVEGLTLVTGDDALRGYSCDILWAAT